MSGCFLSGQSHCFGGLRREPLVGREVGLILLEVEAIGAAH